MATAERQPLGNATGDLSLTCRNFPLKLSSVPFCQGLPGVVSAVSMPSRAIHRMSAVETSSKPLSDRWARPQVASATRRRSSVRLLPSLAREEVLVGQLPIGVLQAKVDVLDDAVVAVIILELQIVGVALDLRDLQIFARLEGVLAEQVLAPVRVVSGAQEEVVDREVRLVFDGDL